MFFSFVTQGLSMVNYREERTNASDEREVSYYLTTPLDVIWWLCSRALGLRRPRTDVWEIFPMRDDAQKTGSKNQGTQTRIKKLGSNNLVQKI